MKASDRDFHTAALIAAQAWRAAMDRRNKPCVMSPMDEMAHFLSPVNHDVRLQAGVDLQFLDPNPMRVGIIMQLRGTSSGVTCVRPFDKFDPSDPQAPIGYTMNTTTLPWVLLQSQVGSIVQVEWHALNITSGGALFVTELVLKDWGNP